MNQASTRSHCIFTVHITSRIAGSATVRRSKLHLVDLAGYVSYVDISFAGFLHFLESPGIFIGKFPVPGKSWKLTLVLESSVNLLARSWKVLEFARQTNRHLSAEENIDNCMHQVRFLGCWYVQNAFIPGVPPQTTLGMFQSVFHMFEFAYLLIISQD